MADPQRIALLPLDDRPVNTDLPRDVAAVAGVVLDLPPREVLPDYRQAGDPEALFGWLERRAADPLTTHLVVSIDMLLFGGLIPSRISDDDVAITLLRLDRLRNLRAARPDLRILAVGLVMRASKSATSTEEPEYWKDYGPELHRLGGDLHRTFVAAEVSGPRTSVPAPIRADFARRRLRNHIVNLASLGLFQDGVLDVLAITADDTAAFAAGSVEQLWLRHWMRFLPEGERVLMYPGADEVGAVLVARALAEAGGEPAVLVVCPDPEGLTRTPPFENRPLSESVARQLRASGARATDSDDTADVVLVVHAPDPARHDMHDGAAAPDPAAVALTADAVRAALRSGRRVALADVRYVNGADSALVDELASDGTLLRLTAFGGWNTAGNALGGVVATAVAAVVGSRSGRLDAAALHAALLVRLLDDWGYQSQVRTETRSALFDGRAPLTDPTAVARAEEVIGGRLRGLLRDRLGEQGVDLVRTHLPWRRSFEVGLTLERR